MFHRPRILPTNLTLAFLVLVLLGGILLPSPVTPAAYAQAPDLDLILSGPTYVTPGGNITYELTVKNLTSQLITAITIFDPLPVNTTYVSGGTFNAGNNRVELTLASLTAQASHKFTVVVRATNGVAIGTSIDNINLSVASYTIGGQSFGISGYGGIATTVEAPATVVASYKNASGRAFDVKIDGFGFQNYTNEDPPRNASDDLGADDMFVMFGPTVCHSGTTAATCVLSGPAKEWMQAQNGAMNGGHCDGMSVASLRFFEKLPFKGKTTPANFQTGATNTSSLNFPSQPVENYISYYWTSQVLWEVYENKFTAGPVATVNKLIADFNHSPSLSYAVHIFKLPGWKAGHSVAAYGIEKVSANEYRILVYDNNYPKQRQYITVNMAANTWRYVTAATPGNPPDVYEGTATSGNLSLVSNKLRDLPSGQHFECPFCSTPASSDVQAAATDQVQGEFTVQYSGEGAILVVNDEGQRTGDDHVSQTFVDEIPGAEVIHFNGGLGKEIPPRIVVPYTEHDNTIYSVFVHGRSTTSPTMGSLSIHGPGFHIGVNDIDLSPNDLFEFSFSPDGDHISFTSSETIEAPGIFVSHDPLHPGDPSVIFDMEGVTVHAGEKISLDLDPALERIHFDDTGAEDEQFDVIMELIWPDGGLHVYTETVHVPAGATSAFIDFGAWDGLLHPPTYISDTLQNPLVNHRLKLGEVSGFYDSTPQANAPAGVYHAEVTLTNVTEVTLQDLYFIVADLGAGNVLLNADGSSVGQGAKLSIPNTALGDDALLHVNEPFTVRFDIGLANAELSLLTVDANGVPHDWTHEAPPLAGEAHNDSFVIQVRADNPVYLPLMTK